MDITKKKADRENYILELLSQNGTVKINELSKQLNVTRETIRRDLKDLQNKGLLICIHGGATISTPTNSTYEINAANVKYVREKNAIAKKAAELINDYEAVIILASTTTERLAPYLPQKNHLTVITNSFTIATYTLQNPTNSVIVLGGYYDSNLQATTGDYTTESLERYRADKVFFSPRGVSCLYGITSHPESETRVIKTAISVSKKAILLSDYSKFWTVGIYKLCDISEIDTIISDRSLSEKKIKELTDNKIQVILADYLATPTELPASPGL